MRTRSFKSTIRKFNTIFLDSYGVLKNANGLIPGAIETMNHIKESGRRYYLLTNDASRSPEKLAEAYYQLGLTTIHPDQIVSSGMMAREYLRNKIKGGKVAYLGTENSAHYIEETGLETISIKDIRLDDLTDISALVFLDDEGFDWNTDINKTVNLLRRVNVPVVVANSDITYPASKGTVAIATGGVAELVESVVKKSFIHFGKPDSQMFMYAFELVQAIEPDIQRKDILMVGDTLQTDIRGGNKFGLATALVLTGNTSERKAALHIKSTGIIPTYICDSIAMEE